MSLQIKVFKSFTASRFFFHDLSSINTQHLGFTKCIVFFLCGSISGLATICELWPLFSCLIDLFFFSLDLISPLLCLCREREGCGGEEGEAVTEEASQAGDQRRQDGEQSPGESTPPLLSRLFSSRRAKTVFISPARVLLLSGSACLLFGVGRVSMTLPQSQCCCWQDMAISKAEL